MGRSSLIREGYFHSDLHIVPTVLNGMYIDRRLVLYPNRLKTSNVYFNKSVEAIFSSLNHLLHLFERCNNFEFKEI